MYGKKVRLRILFIISVLTTIILSIYIILKLLEDDVVYFKSPTEIKQSSENITKKIRVGGMVKKNSVTLDNEKILFGNILNSFFGKFISISLCWTFSFHILNEIRHLIWDAGYGFNLKISKITGYATLILSFLLAIIIYFLGVSL